MLRFSDLTALASALPGRLARLPSIFLLALEPVDSGLLIGVVFVNIAGNPCLALGDNAKRNLSSCIRQQCIIFIERIKSPLTTSSLELWPKFCSLEMRDLDLADTIFTC